MVPRAGCYIEYSAEDKKVDQIGLRANGDYARDVCYRRGDQLPPEIEGQATSHVM
jgi:hypothetical protein